MAVFATNCSGDTAALRADVHLPRRSLRASHPRAQRGVCSGRHALRATHTMLALRAEEPLSSRFTPRGEVAQLVEHTTENRSVGGPIPPLATTISRLPTTT